MKKLERILGIIAILAVILKLIHVPFSSMLLVLSAGLLAMFYYLSFALLNKIRGRDLFKAMAYQNTNTVKILGAIQAGIDFSCITLGVLFKLQFWPGASLMLICGLGGSMVLFLVSIFFYRSPHKEYLRQIYIRMIIVGGIGLSVFLTPSKTFVEIMYRNHPAYATAFKNVLADPENEQFQMELERQKDIMNGRIPNR